MNTTESSLNLHWASTNHGRWLRGNAGVKAIPIAPARLLYLLIRKLVGVLSRVDQHDMVCWVLCNFLRASRAQPVVGYGGVWRPPLLVTAGPAPALPALPPPSADADRHSGQAKPSSRVPTVLWRRWRQWTLRPARSAVPARARRRWAAAQCDVTLGPRPCRPGHARTA